MLDKKRLSVAFVIIVMIILAINHTVYYFSTRNLLHSNMQEQMTTIAEQVRITIDHSRQGTKFVEELFGEHLRTAALAAKFGLDPDIENVTNEQLKTLRDLIGVTEITLFKKTDDDIIGYRSTKPGEVNLSTKDWNYWYEAFQQLYRLEPVTVKEGQTLPNYWSGPLEISAVDASKIYKWGYYYDGTTNYMINPFIENSRFNQYDELTGPSAMIKALLRDHPFLKEITVFNQGKFCTTRKQEDSMRIVPYLQLSDYPILYGTYNYPDGKQDCVNVDESVKSNKIISYITVVNGQKLFKSFVPVTKGERDYVIGVVSDYSVIEAQLERKISELGLFIALATLLCVPLITITIRFIRKSRDTAVRTTQETYIQEVNDMFTTIRGQRHDFLNHVHTIKAMLDMNKLDELKQYAGELIGEIKEVNDMIQIGHPAIAALVQAKMSVALSKKIVFDVDIVELRSLSLGVKSVDIVKMIGNLVDNAFDEVMTLEPEERRVMLRVTTENDQLIFSVQNPGRLIPQEELTRIFESGYSTRMDGQHSGIGLAVTKERVHHYNGKIEAASTVENGIVFTVTLPLN